VLIKVGDLVQLAPRKSVHNFPRNLGVVIDFVELQNTVPAWGDGDCAKVQWMGGSQTVIGLPMLELAKNA
jgi:hypothetical protein